MTFEERIRQLCEQLAASASEAEAIELSRELQSLIHDRIEGLRGKLLTMPSIGLTSKELKSA
jgi:hypothetical protein